MSDGAKIARQPAYGKQWREMFGNNPRRFDKEHTCPKCGRQAWDVKYASDKDLLEVQCSCGYSWEEQPKDSARKVGRRDR